MNQRTNFLMHIVVAMFIVTWSPDFTVDGVPSRLEQCLEHQYEVACEIDENDRSCQVLNCGRAESNRTSYELYKLIHRRGVLDGTPCGPSKICKHKKCVDAKRPMLQFPVEQFHHCTVRRKFFKDRIKSREQQCIDFGFDVACWNPRKSKDYTCEDLTCGYKVPKGRPIRHPMRKLPFRIIPSMGSFCAIGKACFKRQCIALDKWPISLQPLQYTGTESFWPCNRV